MNSEPLIAHKYTGSEKTKLFTGLMLIFLLQILLCNHSTCFKSITVSLYRTHDDPGLLYEVSVVCCVENMDSVRSIGGSVYFIHYITD